MNLLAIINIYIENQLNSVYIIYIITRSITLYLYIPKYLNERRKETKRRP